MNTLPPRFKEIYEEYYLLHPDVSALPATKLYVMLDLVRKFRDSFYPDANLDVALFAALLHDAGLVYKRTDRSPMGHENRSVEQAATTLKNHGLSDDFIQKVCTAIAATEPDVTPESEEAIIVRNADAYSHLSSIHFFAKAYFADDLLWYIDWFDKKIHGSLKNLTISQLIEEKQPLVTGYEKLLELYRSNKNTRYIDHF